MTASESAMPHALYVHVPFCTRKCNYCDFYSVPVAHDAVPRYLDALETELRRTSDEHADGFTTVYIGGGTPTCLEVEHLERLLDLVRRSCDTSPDAEYTVEANPGTLTPEKLRILTGSGVNRLSIGVQSFDDRLLAMLGRQHSARDAREAIDAARKAGLTNLSIDLIFAIPTETPDDWRRDLDALLASDVPHVSTYSLTWEEGTPLARMLDAGTVRPVDEEDELLMYETAIDRLTASGYEHYEISNFARKDFSCGHNEVYWANASYLGLGPSAASYIAGERRRNVASVAQYASMLERGEMPVDFRETLAPEARARETAIMNLRRTRGMNFDAFRRHTGIDARDLFACELQSFAEGGFLQLGERGARLTRKGLMVADSVLSELT